MKSFLVCFICCGMAATVVAQPVATMLGNDEADIESPETEEVSEWIEPPPPTPPADSPVFQWMQRLRERNPELCEQLEKMYRDNPVAFHYRVRRLMEQERVRLALKRYPAVLDAVSKLSPEERSAFYRDLAGPMPPPSHGHKRYGKVFGRRREPPPPWGQPSYLNTARADVFLRLSALRQRYQAIRDPAEREAIAAEVREILLQISQVRERNQWERLERIESEIARLKQDLQELRARRDEIIQHQVEFWLSPTNTFLDLAKPEQPAGL